MEAGKIVSINGNTGTVISDEVLIDSMSGINIQGSTVQFDYGKERFRDDLLTVIEPSVEHVDEG